MGESTKNILVFALGTIVGAVLTYKVVRDKCEKEANEEIESVKKAFREMESLRQEAEINALDESGGCDESLADYARILDANSYISNDNNNEKKGGEDVKHMYDTPQVINPNDYGELYDYEEISLTYYNDGILADENDDPLSEDEIKDMVGLDFATHFGEYEEDSVFIRNDAHQVDYEILKDYRNYYDVFPDAPRVNN